MRYPVETLNPSEVRALISKCNPRCATGLRNRALIVVLWRAGLRISEALALESRDINGSIIRIRHGKGDKSRVVALDDEASAVLNIWIKHKATLGIGGPVFSTFSGKAVLSSYVRDLMKRLQEKAGITKRVHAHGLRHTFASELAEERVDIRVIQRALGHGNLDTTARYIDHLRPTAVIDALQSRTWA